MFAHIEIKALQWALDNEPTLAAFDAKYGAGVRQGLAPKYLEEAGGRLKLTELGRNSFVARRK